MTTIHPMPLLRPTGKRTPAGDPIYVLAESLQMQGYTIPAGTLTDLASTPRWVQNRLPPGGPWAPAAILHDWLYQKHYTTRAQADGLFLEAMTALGVPLRQRIPMWVAVSLFGGAAWAARLGWAP